MIPDETPLFGMGHNTAGMDSREAAVLALNAFLTVDTQDGGKTFADRRDEFVRAAKAAVVRSRDTAGAAADIVRLANEIRDRIEAERIRRSNPYRDVQHALKAKVDEFWLPVEQELNLLRERVREWDKAESDRIATQASEQDAVMQRVAAAQNAGRPGSEVSNRRTARRPPKARPIRGDYGGKVTQSTREELEIVDLKAIPDFILDTGVVRAAIIEAARTYRRLGGEIPGIKVTPVTVTNIS